MGWPIFCEEGRSEDLMAKEKTARGPKPVEERNFIYRAFWSFTHGDLYVKLSALIAGMSCFKRKQYLKGALQTAA